MKKVFVDSLNIVSVLGGSAEVNFEQVLNGISGVSEHYLPAINEQPVWVSVMDDHHLDLPELNGYSRFEKLLILSVTATLEASSIDVKSNDTLFVFSTTKGSISLIDSEEYSPALKEKMELFYSAKRVTEYFKNKNKPVVISNACISGVAALIYAKRLLMSADYKNIVVTGADTVSKFVYSGFQSFQALSPGPCHPFSATRDGINLGEAGATIILCASEKTIPEKENIFIDGGSISNDSNHISGPSRTGIELSDIINNAIHDSGLTPGDIDFISAHGTATPYNDEMEAKAFLRSGLHATPVNSLKGYFGHTLGAAGLVESAISIMSLKQDVAVASKGFEEPVMEPELNIIKTPLYKSMKHCLKTASGFGGCNAAIIFTKN